jgi:large subunit ribosomal protein L16
MGGVAKRGTRLAFGDYGLKCLGRGWLSAKQIEAARVAVSHYTKRAGKLWIRVFPHKPVTTKGLGVGMGSGKGEIDRYVVTVRPGRVVLELAGVSREMAIQALTRAGNKLPFKTRFMERQ